MALASLSDLAIKLKIPVGVIKEVKANLEKHYDFIPKAKIDYITGKKVFDNGKVKVRPIHPSKGELYKIQSRLASFLASTIKVAKAAHGGVKGRSCITFILPHIGYDYHFCTDLEKFFPTVTYDHVVKAFIDFGCSHRMAKDLAKLTTYSCPVEGHSNGVVVPQGAPTSSIVTNMVFHRVDLKIENFCQSHEIIYTRYVDDLMFSSKVELTSDIIHGIIGIITAGGFKINRTKTNARKGVVEAVGICLNPKGLQLTTKQKEKIKFLKANPDDERNKNLKFLEEDYRKQLQKAYKDYIASIEQSINNRNVPIMRIDDSLEKYEDKVLFPKKLEKANETLASIGLPKQTKQKSA